MPINIAIADTEFLMRKGLKALIDEQSTFNFVAEVTTDKDLKKMLSQKSIDVLIIDHCCDTCFSIASIQNIKISYPHISILVISHQKSAEEIKKIIDLGIKNYLLKDCDEQEIIDAISSCAEGKKYFCGQIIDLLLDKEISTKNHCATGGISEREIDVIKALVEGDKTIRIAKQLNISEHTVMTHKKNIYKKLNLKNNIELMQYALKTKILNLEPFN